MNRHGNSIPVSIRNAVLTTRLARECLLGLLAVLIMTAVGLLVQPWTGHWSIALFYLAVVIFLATRLSRVAILLMAALTGVLWNFLFIPPQFTLRIAHLNDALMFGIYLLVALTMGHLTSRLRSCEVVEKQQERRTRALYRLAQCIIESPNLDAALGQAVHETEDIFHAEAAIVLAGEDGRLTEAFHPSSSWTPGDAGRAVALWCHSQGVMAGRFTSHLPEADSTYAPLSASGRRLGVLALRFNDRTSLDADETELLQAVSDHVAAMIQRYDLTRQAERVHLAEESERLYRTLFSCVSHELKTPLAVIDAAARQLRAGPERGGAEALLRDVEDASLRLREVVDNLLDMSRIESGRLAPDPQWQEVDEMVDAVCDHARGVTGGHRLLVDVPADLPAVRVDADLFEPALGNLLVNAAQYSARGTEIAIRARVEGSSLIVDVEDRGGGIPAESLDQVFRKFYRGPNARPGGTGLGLAIVAGLVQALGGSVSAANRAGGGAVFSIRVPVQTARIVEDEL